MGPDVLASSLGIAEGLLLRLIQGLESTDYQTHIAHRLKEAGVPPGWLNQSGAPLRPEFVNQLRKLAATSPNLAPIRRRNFQTLVDAFEGRVEALADALDLVETSVRGIADGRLPIDDERCNHLNPRLMEGGFPDGWLDQPDASVPRAWVAQLEQVANEDHLREERELSSARVAAASAPRPTPRPAAAPVAPASVVVTTPAPAPVATAPAPEQATIFDIPQTSPAQSPAPQPAMPAAAPPASAGEHAAPSAPLETSMPQKQSTPSFKPGNFAGAAKPPGTALPRGVYAAGRDTHQPPATGRPGAAGATGKVGAPIKTGKTVLIPKAAPVRPAVSAASTKLNTRAGKSPISKAQSIKRAEALESILATARRGVKVKLWRDLLKSSLPYWGNIRRGSVMLRDEMADDITRFLGLPQGWLDNATFPPPSLAAWVTDVSAPEPTSDSKLPAAQTPAPTPAAPRAARQPFARPALPSPTATIIPPKTAPVLPAKAANAAPKADALPPPVAEASLVVSHAAHAAIPPIPGSGEGVFQWTPARAERLAAPGPMVQALGLVINQLSVDGRFTDQDALRLLTMLMTTR